MTRKCSVSRRGRPRRRTGRRNSCFPCTGQCSSHSDRESRLRNYFLYIYRCKALNYRIFLCFRTIVASIGRRISMSPGRKLLTRLRKEQRPNNHRMAVDCRRMCRPGRICRLGKAWLRNTLRLARRCWKRKYRGHCRTGRDRTNPASTFRCRFC